SAPRALRHRVQAAGEPLERHRRAAARRAPHLRRPRALRGAARVACVGVARGRAGVDARRAAHLRRARARRRGAAEPTGVGDVSAAARRAPRARASERRGVVFVTVGGGGARAKRFTAGTRSPAGRGTPEAPGYTESVAVLERHQDLVDELLADVEGYKPDADRELLTRAFDFAARAHDGQLRRSGQEFIYHPWGAAKILAGLRLDEATLAAALLHDTVEDTGIGIDDIRSEFGDEIAKLVEGVTKLTRVQFQSREHAEAENYRKLVLAMAEDLRVILIKLADRLHNLRTIEYMGKQTQVRKARETLEVYAPIAHRLGIHALKWELEDLAFQTLHPR